MTFKNPKYNLILAKAIFFTNSLSTVGWGRFQNNFYLDMGLSSYEIGSLKSIGLILKVIGEPLWSFVADCWDPKYIFVYSMIVQIASMEILRVIRPVNFNLVLFVKLLRTVTSSNNTLTNTASFRLTEGSNEGYGKQRMYGSLAWGSGAFLTGILIDQFGMNALFYYTYVFVAVNFALVVIGFPTRSTTPTSQNGSFTSSSSTTLIHSKSEDFSAPQMPLKHSTSDLSFYQYWKDMYQFFSHSPTRALLLNAFGYGGVMTVIDTYLYISLELDYHVSRSFSGICTASSILSCLPVFYYSDILIAKHGHFRMIVIAQVSCVLRLIAYGLLPPSPSSVYIIFILQSMHGINYALYWSAAVDAIYKLAPKNLTSSCMSTLNIMYFTLSGAFGNFLWGLLYRHTGDINYLYLLAACVLTGVVLVLYRSEHILENSIHLSVDKSHMHLQSASGSSGSGSSINNNDDDDDDEKKYDSSVPLLQK